MFAFILIVSIILWFLIGYFFMYYSYKCEDISSAWHSKEVDLNFSVVDYLFCLCFSFMGVLGIFILLVEYFIYRKDMKKIQNLED